MKTKSERFVEENRGDWNSLRNILIKIRKHKLKSLTNEELESFPKLYRKVCQDLAQARMLKLSPDVLEYLNSLTASSHEQLYYMKAITLREIKNFFIIHLPKTIIQNIIFIIISGVLFVGSGVVTYKMVRVNPDLAFNIIEERSLNSFNSMHSDSPDDGREFEINTLMVSYYIQHNISIAFLSFATGIFLGLGTIYFLLFNGIYLGCIFAHITNQGHGYNILQFVTGHSFLELGGLIIAGAAGLLLGYSVLGSWKNYSFDIINSSKNRILILISSAFFMVGSAAFVEGFISPSDLPYPVKVLTLVISIILFTLYFILKPRKRGLIDG